MSRIVTVGEILVEIMAKEVGQGFLKAVSLLVPIRAERLPSLLTRLPGWGWTAE